MARELSRFQRIVCAATMLSWTVAKFLVPYVIVEVVLFPVTTVRRDLEIHGGKIQWPISEYFLSICVVGMGILY